MQQTQGPIALRTDAASAPQHIFDTHAINSPTKKIYGDDEIDTRLTKWQRRHMRLSNLFHEVALAVADDAKKTSMEIDILRYSYTARCSHSYVYRNTSPFCYR